VQADDLASGLPQVIVAMITSQTSRSGHPSRISIVTTSEQGKQSGLLTDSIVMTDNLATIIETALYRVIGSLSMTDVDVALRHTLGL
jgi:mRNA interferase MazF